MRSSSTRLRRAVVLAGLAVIGTAGFVGTATPAQAGHCGSGLDDPGEFILDANPIGRVSLDRATNDVGSDGVLIVEGVFFCVGAVDQGFGAAVTDRNTSAVGLQAHAGTCGALAGGVCTGTGPIGFEVGSCLYLGPFGDTC
ncbi:MAG TPA: hypothetical protein VHF47_08640 [Acidimicrobiales bacterium]|nr:hypothetical protein [Acidimicrobiales bacterium]